MISFRVVVDDSAKEVNISYMVPPANENIEESAQYEKLSFDKNKARVNKYQVEDQIIRNE